MPSVSSSFSMKLLKWFDQFGRHDLPWQQNKTPYRVWVSEIMLQQTQVQTVIPYFERFMARFTSLESLAHASQDEVLNYWAGLGYYARGRNLHKSAQMIVDQHGGQFPQTFEEIIQLPGIGRSTAGAILSIAFKQRFPILDGNVKRVLCRLDAVESWSGEKTTEQRLWQRAEALTPDERYDDYTQAIMDLGATLCSRTKPNCLQCPVHNSCQAFQLNRVKDFPYSKPKIEKPTKRKIFLVLVNSKQQIFLQKRPQVGIWGGMKSLPEFESKEMLISQLNLEDSVMKNLNMGQEFKHTFTHYHLYLTPITIQGVDQVNLDGEWWSLKQMSSVGLPAPIKKIVTKLEREINV